MCILNKGSVNSIPEVKNMDKISVVVPCYNEEEALPVYYKEMCRVMDEMKDVVFELIFVDDGSSDATLGIMKDLNEKDSRWQISFIFQKLWKGSCDLCRIESIGRRLCCTYGCRSSGSTDAIT